jgi:hypothetical protein
MALAGILGDTNDDFHVATAESLIDLAAAATGDAFQVKGRPAEPKRYIRIERRAMELIRDVRRFQRKLLNGWFW